MLDPVPVASPRFSVVVATYNYDSYLRRALDSIIAQEGDDFEVLVVDDGSTDRTYDVVRGYGSRVHYFRQEHAGTFAACRTGARAARGRYVLFVDADDRLRPGALAALRSAADMHRQTRLILAGSCAINRDGRQTVHIPPELSSEPLENFAKFARGHYRATLAGGLIDRQLLVPFDRDSFEFPHGTDRAVLGYALLHPSARIEFVTLDVYDHPGRLRENITSIDRSGLKLADLLFDKTLVPAAALQHRRRFTALLEASRGRAYFRAGWHSKSWRSYVHATTLAPGMLTRPSILRRTAAGYIKDMLRAPEGPAKRPAGHWLFGHHREIWSNPFEFLRRCAQQQGPVARLRLRRPTYFLADPADMRHVLVARANAYHKTGILRAYSMLAGGIIGKDGAEHREHRRAVQPNFQKRSLDGMTTLMVKYVDRQLATWSARSEVDVVRESKRMCADIAAKIIFGCDDQRQTDRLVELLQQTHRSAAAEFRRWIHWPDAVPTRRRRRYAVLLRELDAWLKPFVMMRQRQPEPDILSAMLMSGAVSTSSSDLRERLTMLFLAALEPVSTTLSWGLRLLADHPAMQERIVEEVCSLGKQAAETSADLSGLRYTTMVLNEILRMYPNEWLLTRRAVKEDRLPSGVRIRAGEEVMISPYVIQRDPHLFSLPDRFDPERFAGSPAWPPMAYIPFGAGPRACSGRILRSIADHCSLNPNHIDMACRTYRAFAPAGNGKFIFQSTQRRPSHAAFFRTEFRRDQTTPSVSAERPAI